MKKFFNFFSFSLFLLLLFLPISSDKHRTLGILLIDSSMSFTNTRDKTQNQEYRFDNWKTSVVTYISTSHYREMRPTQPWGHKGSRATEDHSGTSKKGDIVDETLSGVP